MTRESDNKSTNEISPGTVVLIHGLLKDTSLNGKKGLCLRFVARNQRYNIKLITGDKKNAFCIKTNNLRLDDDIVEFIYSNIGDIGHCQVFSDHVTKFYGNNISGCSIGSTPSLDILDMKGRSIYQVNTVAAGHSFIIEFIECSDGYVYSRIFHAFKNKFTAKEWLSQIEWMDNKKTKSFLRNFALLKTKIDAFVADEIIENLIIPEGTSPLKFSEDYANKIMKDSTIYGDGPFVIKLQPFKWDKASISDYGQELGGLIISHPEFANPAFAFSYSVKSWVEIVTLCESLFHAANSDFPLYALSEQGPLAWTWRKILHQEQYE